MQAPRYQVSYYLISEVIKEKQQNWRLDLFHKENTDKEKNQFAITEPTIFISLYSTATKF